ncbi:woronin body major protein [Acrodontium crateriforme]|uniref:Woronin body major protein n=1 Tax=Acrodontium crateriforme TaxID=150365 RepID=A0AAQ3MC70_9PEZI|nr:woronin body major protein [Acrodontium crateriforme]
MEEEEEEEEEEQTSAPLLLERQFHRLYIYRIYIHHRRPELVLIWKVDDEQIANLDFDARVPVPFSVFPSAYKNTEQSTETEIKTEESFTVQDAGREGRHQQPPAPPLPSRREDRFIREDIRVTEEDRYRPSPSRVRREQDIHIYEDDRRESRYTKPYQRYSDAQLDVDTRIDAAERDYRRRTATPFTQEYRASAGGYQDQTTTPRQYPAEGYAEREQVTFDEKVTVREERTTEVPRHSERKHRRDMGYYDEDGHYHSFRHGLHRAADRVLYGKHHQERPIEREEDIIIEERQVTMSSRPTPPNTITIPCHHIRIGDLLILQGRPCQVIRITTSAQTGQHRYLGVDLFTKQLNEESSFISNPSPSVIVQNMLGPVFKQYRVLDIRDDGCVVAMTETGDVKQGLPVLDQSNLSARLAEAFNDGRGSVRVLVINDEGRELAVDYKVVHGSRL